MAFWKKLLITFGAFVLLFFLFNSVVMPWYVSHDNLVKVPNVTGMSFEDAKKTLDEADLEGIQGDIRYDPSVPIGSVMEQNPSADLMVKDGRRIYLMVSGGEQLYDVPNLVGRTFRESKFTLGQRNLELVQIEEKQSAQYPPGIIISQIESAGSKVKKGTKIGVIVSVGMDAGNIKVPDVTGKSIEEARKLIIAAKLMVGKITYQPSVSVPLNSIIDQYPKANSLANENTRVDIFVNRELKKKVEQTEEPEGTEDTDLKNKETDKDIEKPKDGDKKNEIKKDDKSPKPDSKDEKKDDKKKTEPVKPKEKKDTDKKDEGGTQF